jgi:hypothetical protein
LIPGLGPAGALLLANIVPQAPDPNSPSGIQQTITDNRDGTTTTVNSYPNIAHSTQDQLGATINVNTSGAFFQGSAYVNGGPSSQHLDLQYITPTGGTGLLYGQSLQLQVTVILHELAHNLNLVKPDANQPNNNQSMLNTGIIVANCGAGIKAIK